MLFNYLDDDGVELNKPVPIKVNIKIDDDQAIERIAPYLTYAFFSGSDLTEEDIYELIDFVHQFDVKVVGVTRGEDSVISSVNGEIYKQSPFPTELKDTIGAGDSFIAGFLTHYINDFDVANALENAAKSAAYTCSHYGAIGYPKEKIECKK